MDALREISTKIENVPDKILSLGEPIFMAFGCYVLEKATDSGYLYLAVNPQDGIAATLCLRKTFIGSGDTKAADALLEKLKQSGIAGYGQLMVDRKFGKQMTLKNVRKIMSEIFSGILPKYGFDLRESQAELADEIMAALNRRQVMLAEGETGTGKTWAYLVAAILSKRGRVNDFWNMGFYPKMQYVEMAHMPIVVSTSSIALQKALVDDYIPMLSNILLAHGVIEKPITAVLRKGRGHYVCERKLRVHLKNEADHETKIALAILLKKVSKQANIDLMELPELSPYTKRRISVLNRCAYDCPYYADCAYMKFRDKAQSNRIDIQVCNHQYLLADTICRAENRPPLIPNYQSVIIDEAHRFYQAAQSMYGVEFSNGSAAEVKENIGRLAFRSEKSSAVPLAMAKTLNDENKRLFRELAENGGQSQFCGHDESADESERLTVQITHKAVNHFLNMLDISDELVAELESAAVAGSAKEYKAQIIREIKTLQNQIDVLLDVEDFIFWLETDGMSSVPDFMREIRLCTVPKNLSETLYRQLFKKDVPIVLTSGTISSKGDFSHIKRQLGLKAHPHFKITETSKPSPFDYHNNAMLYIGENMPFPDNKDGKYIFALATEIEELLYASHGHAAVLFTSYRAMDMVWEHLSGRGLPFPMFRLDRGAVSEIERFKQSGNGVLFASGSLWEGIDIPGDILSLLIIPKLPFAAPDPVNEYERILYVDLGDFKRRVIIPEMLIKMKQGFGRLIRTVTDTGVVAILDSRVNSSGSYRKRVLDALPNCYATDDMGMIEGFMRVKKPADYFQ